MEKAIVLLSGGLDSYVALDIANENYKVDLALNFNYGQKAFKDENIASKKIAKKYHIKIKTINLPFLKKICDNALTEAENSSLDKFDDVWIPNRNGLFLNIAACFCDRYQIQNIIMGLNYEEAQKFSDNSIDFIKFSDKAFFYSTQIHCKIIAPCQKMTKIDIVNYAIDNNLSFDLIKSCYDYSTKKSKKHCGKCMSCSLLYNAINKSKKPELLKEVF